MKYLIRSLKYHSNQLEKLMHYIHNDKHISLTAKQSLECNMYIHYMNIYLKHLKDMVNKKTKV